jgi:phage tail-like protein
MSSLSITSDYPPSAFYFKVVLGATLGLTDSSFQEVSGIGAEMDTEPLAEGGENRYKLMLPTGIKHSNLELKRGIASMASPLVLWCKSVFEMDFATSITTQPVAVYLMNEDQLPIRAWSFDNAFPVKWDVEPFNSTKNEVAIEKIVLSYTSSNRLI